MPISLTSPNVDNYIVGKGIVYTKFSTDSDYVDMGNVTSLEFTPKVTKLDHFSSRLGTKKKDKTVVILQEASLKLVVEEYTARNLALMLLGTITQSGSVVTIDIMTEPLATISVKYVAQNDIGPQWTFEFPICVMSPSAAMNPISDEWGKMEMTADVFADEETGSFGTASATFA